MTATPWGATTPDLGRFRVLARTHRVIPVARRLLADELTPTGVAPPPYPGIDVGFSRNRHHRATIEEFAHNLKGELLAVISRCITTEREGYTPSDFKLTDISQDQLDDLIDDVENL